MSSHSGLIFQGAYNNHNFPHGTVWRPMADKELVGIYDGKLQYSGSDKLASL